MGLPQEDAATREQVDITARAVEVSHKPNRNGSDWLRIWSKNSQKSRLAVGPVNFEVKRGELLVILGPSGCGKTTLLRVLAGIDRPTSGEIWINPKRREEGIAYISQYPLLLPWRTLLQNACLGAEIKDGFDQDVVDRVRMSIQKFRLSGHESKMPKELSGGMAQRVALIRALQSQPKLLFCDEPFSQVDFVSRFELNKEFRLMCLADEVTTVFVTHNIEEAIFLGQQILVMSGSPGRVIGTYGTADLARIPNRHNPVECRNSAEFSTLFHEIWDDLKRGRQDI